MAEQETIRQKSHVMLLYYPRSLKPANENSPSLECLFYLKLQTGKISPQIKWQI
jgi:hypothetical protein